MASTGLGERLQEILKNACHKNLIHNVVVDWLVNGSVSEKTDANTVIKNAKEALQFINGFNHQINTKFDKKNFFREVNAMLFKLLHENPDFSNKKLKNRKHIEIRGWLLPNYALTLHKKNYDEGLEILKGFLNKTCDRKVTIYWALISILYNLPYLDVKTKRDFVNEYFGKIGNDTRPNARIKDDRICWLFGIWYTNHEDEDPSGKEDAETHFNILKDML